MNNYCVKVEFYDNGKILACMTSSGKRGKSHYREMPGMSAFRIWFVSETTATDFLAGCKSGEFDVEDVMLFYSDIKNAEKSFLDKRKVA